MNAIANTDTTPSLEIPEYIKVYSQIDVAEKVKIELDVSFYYYLKAICTFSSEATYFDISDRADTLVELLHAFGVSFGSHLVLNLPNYVTTIFEKHLSSVGYYIYYEVPTSEGISLVCVSHP